MSNVWRKHRGGERLAGSVTLECVLALPIVLVLILACVQFAHVWVARMMTHYAAFCAARAALVHVCYTGGPSVMNDSWPNRSALGGARSEAEWAAQEAASEITAWVVMGSAGNTGAELTIPGWGAIPGSDAAVRKTRTTLVFEDWNVKATVELDFALVMPLIGPIMAWGMNPWDRVNPWSLDSSRRDKDRAEHGQDSVLYPHITLSETVWLPKPYRTVIATGNWN